VYIIIDALDECPNSSGFPKTAREKVLDLLEELVDLNLPNLRICVTSRPEIDIRIVIEPLTSHHISVHDEDGQKKDILDYVRHVILTDRKMRRWRPEDKRLVIDTLSERADGMQVVTSRPLTAVTYFLVNTGSGGLFANWTCCALAFQRASVTLSMTYPKHWTKHTNAFC
jgi:hypothetical protein